MIDDSKITYEKFPLNTYKISAWSKWERNDSCLKEAMIIMQEMIEAENIQQELPFFISVMKEFSF